MKFATKPIQHYPPHFRHVATLPWEITNPNFLQIFSRYGRKCKQIAFLINIASNFVIHPQIPFTVLKILMTAHSVMNALCYVAIVVTDYIRLGDL